MEWERQRTYDRYEGIAIGLAEGRTEGRNEGIQQKALETARIAIQNNLSTELIHTLTGLSIKEIDALKEE